MLRSEDSVYIKIPRVASGILVKSIIQAVISCKNDKRSHPDRLDMTEYVLLQFANELTNTEEVAPGDAKILDSILDESAEEPSDDARP